MRLKKIKLAGFKSFVDPTTIPFPGDMTAIVGPNGCGKSNVIDAVRWVLGESSAKNLRGDAMTDVIFNGSSARKPVGQCSVELVFDNDSQRLSGEYAGYAELAVKRLVTREGQSTYFLNNTRCRRKDVTDVFLGTGLGPRSYAIIEQGMISRLIESRPQELRNFLEEAAGVSRYKERRRDTEHRIRHTQENLERLDDVRGELTAQLDKLSQQAAAAKQYTELKAQERHLKGQLAALRWRGHDTQCRALTSQQQVAQRELDALQASAQQDETRLLLVKEKANQARLKLDDWQQQKFTLGTDITRLEQSSLHSQQRLTAIEQQHQELVAQQGALQDAVAEARQLAQAATNELAQLQPEYDLAQAQREQCDEALQQAQEAQLQVASTLRDVQQRYQHKKDEVQQAHSQIQSALSVQQRTFERLQQLKKDVAELEQQTYEADLAQARDQQQTLTQEVAAADQQYQQAEQQLAEASQMDDSARQAHAACQSQQQSLNARIAGLQQMQQAATQTTPSSFSGQPLWQHIQVSPDWQQAAESALAFLHQPLVQDANGANENETLPPGKLILAPAQSHKPDTGVSQTLASVLEQGSLVPKVFNQFLLCPDATQARARQASLCPGQWLLTAQGEIFGPDASFVPGQHDNPGALQRTTQIATLTAELEAVNAQLQTADQQRADAADALEAARQHALECHSQWRARQASLQAANERIELLEQAQQRHADRLNKLREEYARQQQLEADEAGQLEHLSDSLGLLEGQLEALGEQTDELQGRHDQRAAEVEQQRARQRQYTSQQHQLALRIEQQSSQQTRYSEQATRSDQQQQRIAAQLAGLEEEMQQLAAPLDSQHTRLQSLLAAQQELEANVTKARDELTRHEQVINDSQQAQQSLQQSLHSRQQRIDSLTIEIESQRARADALLEQFSELDTRLQTVLDTLPSDAQESTLQQALTRCSKAVARLGAVNLAAVQEYQQQAARKAQLDEQCEDLQEALETLQAAIRKIDKETRSRFASTFNQVNEDLKALFPKVFGGGSAYLELTDDDLLETGVTIMARPPGKKNSTIHLLSGGEKALTALSLVFAIFRLNPAPFCLLDEVDAPLDDANVGRFCNLVSEMSQTVQFIYITHNKIAMEMATHLTGVTMAEPGVSRMVAVDVDEAMAFVEA